MKKQIILLIALCLSYNLYCQVYFPPEDFSGTEFPPPGWTIENGGASNTFLPGPMPNTTEPSCAWIETNSNMEVDDRIISYAVYLPDTMNAKLFVQMRGSVGYALAMYWDPDNKVRHFIEVSNDGGTTWDIVLDLDDQASVQAAGASFPWPDWEWFDVAITIDAYAGDTILFAYHHEKEFDITGGGSFGVTNMGIWEEVTDDVQLQSMNMQEYCVVDEEVEIGGVLKNIGNADVTSFEGEYLINGVQSSTFSISGINIPQFGTYEFTVDDPAIFTNVDYHTVELVITKVNDQPDSSPENNTLSKDISVASAIVDRIPLFEMFTSSTCPTCPGGNENIDGILFANSPETYSLVKYQMNWPGAGDPYYIDEGGVRKDYYSVMGIPRLVTNGKKLYSSFDFSQADFNDAVAQDAYIGLELDYVFDGINISAELIVDPSIFITDASVHFAIIEKMTYNNVGNNGETEFRNVLMKMMPDGNGTSATLEAGNSQTFNAEANLLTTFIEEFDDLMIVAWVQDNVTQTIMQSESQDLLIVSVAENSFEDINIYPNPTKDKISIQGFENGMIEIYDYSGKAILEQRVQEDFTTIDLSLFGSGIYLLKLTNGQDMKGIYKIIVQ